MVQISVRGQKKMMRCPSSSNKAERERERERILPSSTFCSSQDLKLDEALHIGKGNLLYSVHGFKC